MSQKPKKPQLKNAIRRVEATSPSQAEFDEVLALIDAAKARAFAAVNTALIDLYWSIGRHISRKIAEEGWGQGTVEVLAETIRRRYPTMRGFSARNLWRMMQFYETYRGQSKLSALLTELSWTHHLLIIGKCKRAEEREFYLRMAYTQQWPSRELERQINGALFERVVLSPVKLSPPVTELHPDAASIFKDTYLVEFLDLPSTHSEGDLQRGLVEQLKQFLLELGRDFCFIGAEYPVQVGGRDFALDLLFFNRALNALVAFELKVVEFEPEHLGKMQFYLEALDRDVKKPHEQPSIGVLLCATKNNEVVEYALSRSMSPALVAEYQTRLPDRKLLQAKLHEFYALAQSQAEANARPEDSPQPARRPAATMNGLLAKPQFPFKVTELRELFEAKRDDRVAKTSDRTETVEWRSVRTFVSFVPFVFVDRAVGPSVSFVVNQSVRHRGRPRSDGCPGRTHRTDTLRPRLCIPGRLTRS